MQNLNINFQIFRNIFIIYFDDFCLRFPFQREPVFRIKHRRNTDQNCYSTFQLQVGYLNNMFC